MSFLINQGFTQPVANETAKFPLGTNSLTLAQRNVAPHSPNSDKKSHHKKDSVSSLEVVGKRSQAQQVETPAWQPASFPTGSFAPETERTKSSIDTPSFLFGKPFEFGPSSQSQPFHFGDGTPPEAVPQPFPVVAPRCTPGEIQAPSNMFDFAADFRSRRQAGVARPHRRHRRGQRGNESDKCIFKLSAHSQSVPSFFRNQPPTELSNERSSLPTATPAPNFFASQPTFSCKTQHGTSFRFGDPMPTPGTSHPLAFDSQNEGDTTARAMYPSTVLPHTQESAFSIGSAPRRRVGGSKAYRKVRTAVGRKSVIGSMGKVHPVTSTFDTLQNVTQRASRLQGATRPGFSPALYAEDPPTPSFQALNVASTTKTPTTVTQPLTHQQTEGTASSVVFSLGTNSPRRRLSSGNPRLRNGKDRKPRSASGTTAQSGTAPQFFIPSQASSTTDKISVTSTPSTDQRSRTSLKPPPVAQATTGFEVSASDLSKRHKIPREEFEKVQTWYAKEGKLSTSRVSQAFPATQASTAPLRQSLTFGELKEISVAHVIPPSDTPPEDFSERKPAASELPLLDECNVCYETNVRGYYLACDHKQYVSCMTMLLRAALGDSSLLPLRCCGVPVDMNVAIELLGKDELDKLERQVFAKESNNAMYCPQCNIFLNLEMLGTMNWKTIQCDCGAALCVECKTLQHEGLSCKENKAVRTGSDDLVLRLSKKKGWKRCPNCRSMIEKNQGCSHMTCINCKHHFCFKCLSKWDTKRYVCSSNCQ